MTISILAPGITDAVSTDIVVAQGQAFAVGIYSDVADAKLPRKARFIVEQVTPSQPNFMGLLEDGDRSYLLAGPGTYRVRRRAYSGPAFGVFKSPGA